MPEPDDPTSFAQEYDPKTREAQTLHLYCRLCRRIFPVRFKPRPEARLKCLCGHDAPLSEFDVFKSETRARDFAQLYERIYRAAKDTLREAGFPVPPSGKLPVIRDGVDIESSDLPYRAGDVEDASDIASSYVGEGSDLRGTEAREKEDELRARVETAEGILERHEALTELLEHLYVVRHLEEASFARFEAACREDMALARDVIEEAKARKRAGQAVRVAFSSFKHLGLVLEERADLAGALRAAEAAQAVGLPGYGERIAELRARLAKARSRSSVGKVDAKKSSTGKSSQGKVDAKKSSGDAKAKRTVAQPKPLDESEPIVLSTSSDAVSPSSADLIEDED